jgi:hypothetical protein
MSVITSINRLQELVSIIPAKLHALTDEDFSFKRDEQAWSKKKILGHLIDSAANNHHRFIRAQYLDVPVIFYNQDEWVRLNNYQQLHTRHIISLWTVYNQHLVEVIKAIPEEHLLKEANSGGENNYTLQWLIDDYVVHMEHHLKQLVVY